MLSALVLRVRAQVERRHLEREAGIEPAAFPLEGRCSTTEPLPRSLGYNDYTTGNAFIPLKKWAVRDSNSHGSSPTDPKSALSTNFSNRPFIVQWESVMFSLSLSLGNS